MISFEFLFTSLVVVLVAHGFRRHVIGSLRLRQWLRFGFSAAFAGLGVRLALSDHRRVFNNLGRAPRAHTDLQSIA